MVTVKQLKEYLNQFPDDMEIVSWRYSDVQPILKLEDEISVIEACEVHGSQGEWYMRAPNEKVNDFYHKNQTYSYGPPKKYLQFTGN